MGPKPKHIIQKTIRRSAILLLPFLLAGYKQGTPKPEGTFSAAELLEYPIYDTQIRVYGEVSALGELRCTCFFLQSSGDRLIVWYDTMVEENGSMRPSVSVDAIKNGDRVVVLGELKSGGDHASRNDFWLHHIEVIR